MGSLYNWDKEMTISNCSPGMRYGSEGEKTLILLHNIELVLTERGRGKMVPSFEKGSCSCNRPMSQNEANAFQKAFDEQKIMRPPG